jgi:hypothetical protein
MNNKYVHLHNNHSIVFRDFSAYLSCIQDYFRFRETQMQLDYCFESFVELTYKREFPDHIESIKHISSTSLKGQKNKYSVVPTTLLEDAEIENQELKKKIEVLEEKNKKLENYDKFDILDIRDS